MKNWKDFLTFGSVIASVALSAGVLLTEVRGLRELVEEQKTEIKAATAAITTLQIDGAKRSAEFLLLDRRLTQIERRLDINR